MFCTYQSCKAECLLHSLQLLLATATTNEHSQQIQAEEKQRQFEALLLWHDAREQEQLRPHLTLQEMAAVVERQFQRRQEALEEWTRQQTFLDVFEEALEVLTDPDAMDIDG